METKKIKMIIKLFTQNLKKMVLPDNTIDQSKKAKAIMYGLLNQYQLNEEDKKAIDYYVESIVTMHSVESKFKNTLAKIKSE